MSDRVSRQDLILLYLNKYINLPRNPYEMPQSMTQDGIACALKMSRNHVSNVLKVLEEKGLVEHGLVHSGGGTHKRRVYYLMPEAIASIPEIERRLENTGITVREFCESTYPASSDVSLNILKANAELENASEAMRRLLDGEGTMNEVLRSVNRAMECLIREVA